LPVGTGLAEAVKLSAFNAWLSSQSPLAGGESGRQAFNNVSWASSQFCVITAPVADETAFDDDASARDMEAQGADLTSELAAEPASHWH